MSASHRQSEFLIRSSQIISEQNWRMLTDYEEVAHLRLLDFDGLISLFAEIFQYFEMVKFSKKFADLRKQQIEPSIASQFWKGRVRQ